jgi:hypothetical protein
LIKNKFSQPAEEIPAAWFATSIYRIFPKIRNMASAIELDIEAVEAIKVS